MQPSSSTRTPPTTSRASSGSAAYMCYQAHSGSTPVRFGTLNNVEIKFLGDLEMPRSIPCKSPCGHSSSGVKHATDHLLCSDVQQIVNASGGRLYWFSVTGTNITLTGNQHNPDKGWINWHGWNWWKLAPVTKPLGGIVSRLSGNPDRARLICPSRTDRIISR